VSIIEFLRHIQLIFSLTYKDVESRKMFRGRQQFSLTNWPAGALMALREYPLCWMREFTKRLIRSGII
jgi:hypothetical protein